jgi:hypothetical protein
MSVSSSKCRWCKAGDFAADESSWLVGLPKLQRAGEKVYTSFFQNPDASDGYFPLLTGFGEAADRRMINGNVLMRRLR